MSRIGFGVVVNPTAVALPFGLREVLHPTAVTTVTGWGQRAPAPLGIRGQAAVGPGDRWQDDVPALGVVDQGSTHSSERLIKIFILT